MRHGNAKITLQDYEKLRDISNANFGQDLKVHAALLSSR